jgi:4-diphosphocytidyl-2-C-methyl-D-erythritol kinase
MTGSGAGVFASFASESDADTTLRQVPATWRAWKARALAKHPMAHLLLS